MKFINKFIKAFLIFLVLFVVPMPAFADIAFDPDDTQFFDPSDSNNIAYYLNNDFYNSLSQKNLIESHYWDIKYPNGTGSQADVNCKIGLISSNEYLLYSNNHNGNISFPTPVHNWFTRTPYSIDYPTLVYEVRDGILNSVRAYLPRAVCPTLYLKSGLKVSSSKVVNETIGTSLHDEAPGTVITFSGVEWIIIDQMADGTTYVILSNDLDSVQFPPAALDPPTGLYVNTITTTSAVGHWTAVSGATSYAIYFNDSKIWTTLNTSYTMTNLQPGTTYNVSVAAVANGVEGERCIPVTFTTEEEPPPPDPPDVPTGLYVDMITTTSAVAIWIEVQGASGYTVFLDGLDIGITQATSFPVSNLQPGTTYNVSVLAVVDGVEGEQCNQVPFTTEEEIEEPIWTPLPGVGMGFQSDTGAVFDNLKLMFSFLKGAIWPFVAAFIALFTVFLLWKIWRRAAR